MTGLAWPAGGELPDDRRTPVIIDKDSGEAAPWTAAYAPATATATRQQPTRATAGRLSMHRSIH